MVLAGASVFSSAAFTASTANASNTWDAAGRSRLAAEIVHACREATSPDFPVSFRISNWKDGDYDAVLEPEPE